MIDSDYIERKEIDFFESFFIPVLRFPATMQTSASHAQFTSEIKADASVFWFWVRTACTRQLIVKRIHRKSREFPGAFLERPNSLPLSLSPVCNFSRSIELLLLLRNAPNSAAITLISWIIQPFQFNCTNLKLKKKHFLSRLFGLFRFRDVRTESKDIRFRFLYLPTVALDHSSYAASCRGFTNDFSVF